MRYHAITWSYEGTNWNVRGIETCSIESNRGRGFGIWNSRNLYQCCQPHRHRDGYVRSFHRGAAEKKQQTLKGMKALHPIGRLGNPEEIAGAVIRLCSNAASFMLGQSVAVDGGFTTI